MKINKSTRHSKIAGDFGESLVLYWLSKYEFECAKIDHTGIDLIAANPRTKERLGISVKCRTRLAGKESDCVTLKSAHLKKIRDASETFGCQPYLAIVVEAGKSIWVMVTPISRALHYCPATSAGSSWKMSPLFLSKYAKDKEVMMFELEIRHGRWWIPTATK